MSRTKKYEHITPVLRSLHWLLVTFKIHYKVLLVYKYLNSLGPQYIADMLTEYKPISQFIRFTFLDVSEETDKK